MRTLWWLHGVVTSSLVHRGGEHWRRLFALGAQSPFRDHARPLVTG
jgi:hypothetical protein